MKYVVASQLEAYSGKHFRLMCAPADDDGPDHLLYFYVDTEEDPTGDEGDMSEVIHVKASQLYAFVDWLRAWCPDPRGGEGGDDDERYSDER